MRSRIRHSPKTPMKDIREWLTPPSNFVTDRITGIRALPGNPSARQLKVVLSVLAISFAAVLLYVSQEFIEEVRKREIKTIEFFAKAYKYHVNLEQGGTADFTFLLAEIIPTINFPMIYTDANDSVMKPYDKAFLNLPENIDGLSEDQQKEILTGYIRDMKEMYPPILIEDNEGRVISKMYYANSPLVTRLRLFPFMAIGIFSAFIYVAYLSLNHIRRSQQQSVWVGMAKEAAHQLGTPLSSLMAWMEILRLPDTDSDKVHDIVREMEVDIERLSKISQRFSKIGSKPERTPTDVCKLLTRSIRYVEQRLPHLGRKVEITKDFQPGVMLPVNTELFEWVVENLVKNAAEAIEGPKGKIAIRAKADERGHFLITVSDNGKGMTAAVKREVFRPGFTTKKRGWGLGLSLCKRIVEEYHEGKIRVKETAVGKGTTFEISIPMKLETEAVTK